MAEQINPTSKMIIEPITTSGERKDIANTILAGYERLNMSGFNNDNAVCVGIRQATEKGYISMELGGVADLSYPDSKFRRGRVQEGGTICPTLMAGESGICRIEANPELLGGLGNKHSNNGTQYYQQDRVYSSDGVAMAHPAQIPEGSYKYMVEEKMQYRIRKLTPKECFRLMGVRDEDSDKITVSNSQKYKQAGNSIVVDCLMAIFENMFINECESSSLF